VPLIENGDNFVPGEEKYWLGFSRITGIGTVRLRRLINHFEGLSEAWRASAGDLLSAGLEPKLVERTLTLRPKLDLDKEMARLEKLGVTVLIQGGPGYPMRLAQAEGSPTLLYCKGALLEQDELALAVVGTRRATSYGREVTNQICRELAAQGFTIVSGLAKGIDTVAHQAALEAGGRTVAILGCGVDVVYPSENRTLMAQIMEHGALLSEYPPGTQPDASNFPPRNRIISGMSNGVLVVEAGLKSGALITVSFANEQGRDVYAVPGSIFSKMSEGPNQLIRDGARVVTCAGDILDDLQVRPLIDAVEVKELRGDNEVERALLRLLNSGSGEALHIDELGRESGLPIATVSSTLTMMELKGTVKHLGGMKYAAARYTRITKGV
jgi:DNA processing protein